MAAVPCALGSAIWGFLGFFFLWSRILTVNGTTDPCAAIGPTLSAGGVVSNLAAMACMKSFAYDSARSAAIVETLLKTFDMHVYKDISKDSPTPEFPMKVDVMGGLEKIANTVYDNDFEFNLALYDVVNSLNDGHAIYAPYCYYAYLVTFTGFPLISVVEGGQQVVKITPEVDFFTGAVYDATEAALGVSPGIYAGATVVTIDGISAVQYAVQAAEKAGTYKDINARYNTLFSRYAGATSLYYGGLCATPFISAPQADNLTFVVQRVGSTTQETIVVPLLVLFYGSTFQSGEEYWSTYCYESSSLDVTATKATVKKQHVMAKMPHKDKAHMKHAVEETVSTGKENPKKKERDGLKLQQRIGGIASPSSGVSVLVDSYVSTFLLGDKITGVMVFPDFEGSGGDYSEWQSDVYNGVSSLLTNGAERLIIDLQDNGGGYAYLSYVLLEFLFPGVVFPQYPIQNPATPLIRKMVAKSNALMEETKYWLSNPSQYNWAFDTYPYPNDEMFTSSSEYFFPTVNLTFGNTTSRYSSLYSFPDRLPSPLGIDELILPLADTSALFDPSNILILSNGGCYSTCSLFAYLAQEIMNVRVVAVGGFPNLPMAYSAGSAGYSYTLAYALEYDIGYLGFSDDIDAPKPLPVQAEVGYTGAQAYCRDNDSFPADFVFKPANYRLSFTDETVTDIVSIWYQTATFF